MSLSTLFARYLLFLLCLGLLSCQQETPTYKRVIEEKPWRAIQVGGYVMDFPADFNLIEEQGVDSYVGRVQGDEISLFFNYGSYANDLGPTPEEYLQDSAWLMEAAYPFLQPGVEYDDRNWPKIQVLSIRKATGQDSSLGAGCDYVARCQYQGKFFEHPVYLPEETKNTIFQLDTVEYQYRRIAVAKAPYTITTGMYIRDISEKDLALCIATDSLTKAQQELVLKIFSTVRKAR